MNIYDKLTEGAPKKKFAVLIDPDKYSGQEVINIARVSDKNEVDFLFVGGSLLIRDHLESTILKIKENCSIPVIIFPGSNMQVNKHADAILFLSLISGRNPELLIGQHVVAAPYLKESGLEVIPTGYMLIDSGAQTTASYISNTWPIPYEKNDIAVCTAMAGEMLGLRMIYLDGGSGAKNYISPGMVKGVKQSINIPLVVGGGIRNASAAKKICEAGADLLVVGNAIEENLEQLARISEAVHNF